jgi:hypothetical protein
MLTIGVHRKAAVGYMTNALSFIQNQAGALPQKINLEDRRQDYTAIVDVCQRIKIIQRAFDKRQVKAIDGAKNDTSFTRTVT